MVTETRTFEQLEETAVAQGTDIVAIQTPGGPVMGIPLSRVIGRLGPVDIVAEELADLTLAHGHGTLAIVWGDANPANLGYHVKYGENGAGGWVYSDVFRGFPGADGDPGPEGPPGSGTGLYDANWFNVRDYGAVGDDATDDTAAIQDAIDACAAAGGGVVYFPRATKYVVGGPLQDPARSNSQLLLPIRDCPTEEAITIEFRGEAGPAPVVSVIGAMPVPNNLSVIRGTLNAGAGGALLGGMGPVGSFEDFTNLYVKFHDLMVEMPANPVLSALNFGHVTNLDMDNVIVHAGNFDLSTVAAETTATSFGVKTPILNNGAMTRLGVVNVIGFYNGFDVHEHCYGEDVSAWACQRGFVFNFAYHATRFNRMMAVDCKKALLFTGGLHYFSISQLNIEHPAAGTWLPTADIDDPNHYGRGVLKYHVVLSGAGVSANFIQTGGSHIQAAPLFDFSVPLRRLAAGVNLAQGDYVNLYNNAGVITMRKADNTDTSKPAHGWVREAVVAGSAGWMLPLGTINSFHGGLAVGSTYYLGAAGAVTAVVPAVTGNGIQEIGTAISATELLTFKMPTIEAP